MLIAILVFSIFNFLFSGLMWALFAWVLISEQKEKQANSKKEKQVAEKQTTCKENEITQEQK